MSGFMEGLDDSTSILDAQSEPDGGETVTVTCPEGVAPGDTITIDLGEGEVEIAVPDGVGPGDEFEVFAALPQGAESESDDGEANTVTVTCPEGVAPGDTITIDLGEGEVEVTVPDGVGPGGEFDVAVG